MNTENNDTKVENMMIKIKENIKKRGEKNFGDNNIVPNGSCRPIDIPENIKRDVDYINSNWDLRNMEYNISSHRPIVGRLLILGRRLIHGEVRRYIDLMVGKQSEFNASIVRMSNSINSRIDTVNKDANSRVDKKGLYNGDIANYFLFEEKYRGNTEEIKKRQSIFLEYYKNCKNVLDVGCGRGEFMSLLKENGCGIKGVDMSEDMVLFCKKNDLDVVEADALTYLSSLKDKSLDGIFSGQFVEHLQQKELINLLELCYDKMIYGSYFVAETINPSCLYAHQWFYMDMSHTRLIHPETMKFLLESIGFRNIEFRFFSPVPDDIKLKKVDTNNVKEEDKKRCDVINENIDKLNQFLYGNQDYAVVAKK